jgi:hypothetical protein
MFGFRSLFQRWFGTYATWRIRRHAAADGRRGLPVWDSKEQVPFLKSLLSAGRQSLRTLVRNWQVMDEALKAKWLGTEKELEHARIRLDQAEEKANLARAQYMEVHGHEPTTTQTAGRSFRYWLLLVVLAVLELPINSIVYRGLHQNEIETRIIAAGIGLLLAAVAHWLGHLLRKINRTRPETAFAVVLPILTLGLVAGVGYMRAAYMEHSAGTDQQWSPAIVGAVFLVMNALLFAVATVAAYHHYEAFAGDVAKTARIRQRMHAAFDAAEKAVADIKARREKRFESRKAEALATAEEVTRLAGVYWERNLEIRQDGDQHPNAYPASYCDMPTVEVPRELMELEWGKPGVRLASGTDRAQGIVGTDPLMAELERSVVR